LFQASNVYVGETRVDTKYAGHAELTHRIIFAMAHEGYVPGAYQAKDIMVLILEAPIIYNWKEQPISLINYTSTTDVDYQNMTAAGRGTNK
jgi:hypothetical protein